MTAEVIQLAVLVPEDIADEAVIPANEGGNVVQVTRPAAGKQAEGDLGFDPVTGGALLWISLKVVGAFAAKTAAGIVIKELWDRWKAKSKKASVGELKIRFPNGEVYTLNRDELIDLQQLQEEIEKNGKA
jgi:hypothetical protein